MSRRAKAMPPCADEDGGWSLPEVLVALLLGLLVIQLGFGSLVRLEGARRRIATRTDALVALRVSRHVLRREVRHGVLGRDWGPDGDSLWLRAFRGSALVCGSDSANAGLLVSYAGDRAPDPSKDSVLLLTDVGSVEVRALVASAPAVVACDWPDSAVGTAWQLDRAAPRSAVAAKLFERGSYHLADGALRYRRGSSGRQPLTPEVWSPEARWTSAGDWVGMDLVTAEALAGPPWRGLLSWSGDR